MDSTGTMGRIQVPETTAKVRITLSDRFNATVFSNSFARYLCIYYIMPAVNDREYMAKNYARHELSEKN